MKIRELIEELSKYDWDSEVEIEGSLANFSYEINGINQTNQGIHLISYQVIDMDSARF